MGIGTLLSRASDHCGSATFSSVADDPAVAEVVGSITSAVVASGQLCAEVIARVRVHEFLVVEDVDKSFESYRCVSPSPLD